MKPVSPTLTVLQPGEGEHILSVGNIYRMIVTGEETQGKFSIMETQVQPGDGGPYHIHHREDESFLITEGTMVFYDGNKKIPAKTGAFIHCPPGSMRAFRNESDTLAKMLIFYTPGGIEKMIKLDGEIIDPERLTIANDADQTIACPQLSAEFGIDDINSPLPEIN